MTGLVLASGASVALVWGLVEASQDGWASPAIVVSVAGLAYVPDGIMRIG